MAEENLRQQKAISTINNSYARNQILSKKYIAEIKFIYKQIEYSSGTPEGRRKIFNDKQKEINTLIEKLKDLKSLGDN